MIIALLWKLLKETDLIRSLRLLHSLKILDHRFIFIKSIPRDDFFSLENFKYFYRVSLFWNFGSSGCLHKLCCLELFALRNLLKLLRTMAPRLNQLPIKRDLGV